MLTARGPSGLSPSRFMPPLRQRSVVGAASLWILAATATTGGTDHVSAFALHALAVGAALWAWPSKASLRLRDFGAPVMGLLVVVAGTVIAPNPGLAFQVLVRVLVAVLLFAAILVAERDPAPTLLTAAALAGLGQALWAVVQVAVTRGRATAGFFNPNDLAAFLAPLCIWALVQGRRDRRWLLASALLGAGVVATASRSGVLALALGLMILGLRRRAALIAVALGAAGLIAASPVLHDRFFGEGDRYAYSRLEIWRASADVGAQALPLGVGLNYYSEALRQHGVPLTGFVRYPRIATQGHSELAHVFVELGVPGVLALCLAAGAVLEAMVRRRRDAPPGDPSLRADLAILATVVVPALFSTSMHVPPVALVATVWAASVFRTAAALRGASSAGTLTMTRRLPPAMALVLGAVEVLALSGPAMQTLRWASETQLKRANVLSAQHLAQAARAVAPWSQSAALQAARLELRAGRPSLEVVGDLVEVAERFPYSPSAPLMAANVLARNAGSPPQWQVVAGFLDEAARRDPRNALAWTDLGRAWRRAGDLDRARAAFERALQEEPYCAKALMAVAELEPGDSQRLRARARLAADHAADETGRARQILTLDDEARSTAPSDGALEP